MGANGIPLNKGINNMLFRFSIIISVAISLLAMFSLRHLRAAGAEAGPINDDGSRTPVLIELFTSEGCSSCPPADSLLERLDRSQPARGAELIVLSEHVDYWNDIGWKDPYSSHEYSERQSAYAGHFGLSSIYTPQMVVDGHLEFVGSDERRAAEAIESAMKVTKTPVNISSIRLSDDNTIALHLETGPLSSSFTGDSADVLIATADDKDESHVSRGENAGRTLRHVAVLRNLVRVGTVTRTDKFSRDVSIRLNNLDSRNIRLVAIVQEPMAGRVWGVGSTRFSK
jgi:hypothetical protein